MTTINATSIAEGVTKAVKLAITEIPKAIAEGTAKGVQKRVPVFLGAIETTGETISSFKPIQSSFKTKAMVIGSFSNPSALLNEDGVKSPLYNTLGYPKLMYLPDWVDKKGLSNIFKDGS